MSEITDWEPVTDSPDWEAKYAQQLRINGKLLGEVNDQKIAAKENAELVQKLKVDLANQKAKSDRQFEAIKADITTTLRAINLCLLASMSRNDHFLTHRARNFRMRHVAQIIGNELERFQGKKIVSYEDDF